MADTHLIDAASDWLDEQRCAVHPGPIETLREAIQIARAVAIRRTQSEAVRTEGVDASLLKVIKTIVRPMLDGLSKTKDPKVSFEEWCAAMDKFDEAIAAAEHAASLPQHAQSGVVERDAKDYAIEFGGYLADAAYDYAKTINEAQFNNAIEADEISDSYRALQSAIYEFRKRRAALATPSIPAPVAESELREVVKQLRIEANASEELHPGDSDIETMRAAATMLERLATVPSMQTEKGDG